jgi:hypothetical protein
MVLLKLGAAEALRLESEGGGRIADAVALFAQRGGEFPGRH